jgi:hypothetical protein
MNESILAKNLRLSIWLASAGTGGAECVYVKLEDPLAMTQTQVEYEVNQPKVPNRLYHVQEALVIAMRRLISQAMAEGLISQSLMISPSSPGALTKLKAQLRPPKPPGVEVDITLSTDEELL